MSLQWEGEAADREAAALAARELAALRECRVGEPVVLANEFSETHVSKVMTRNGARLLVESPKSGQWITFDPLELEALTWQNQRTVSAMVGRPFAPLLPEVDDVDVAGDAGPSDGEDGR